MDVLIDVKADRSENVPYNYPNSFAYIKKGLLSQYPNYSALCHWHDDIELISVLFGTMDYNINGHVITLQEGEGIFVNARQLHYGFSKARNECQFLCVLLHPLLLCATQEMEQTYITPVLHNEDFSCRVLHKTVPWEKRVLDIVDQLYFHLDPIAPHLHIQSLFYEIWLQLYSNAPKSQKQHKKNAHQLSPMKNMIKFIQDNYKEKITLDDIAAAGQVCKSKCCASFRRYLNQTPINYLIEYRLQKSIDLMSSSDMNITEISYETGFSGTSYFSETFRRHFGYSPLEYRAKLVTE